MVVFVELYNYCTDIQLTDGNNNGSNFCDTECRNDEWNYKSKRFDDDGVV